MYEIQVPRSLRMHEVLSDGYLLQTPSPRPNIRKMPKTDNVRTTFFFSLLRASPKMPIFIEIRGRGAVDGNLLLFLMRQNYQKRVPLQLHPKIVTHVINSLKFYSKKSF